MPSPLMPSGDIGGTRTHLAVHAPNGHDLVQLILNEQAAPIGAAHDAQVFDMH